MKFCTHCGNEVNDDAVICVKCGCAISKEKVDEVTSKKDETKTTMCLIAFILNILSTISLGAFIIPLAWCIPMTIRSYKMYKGEKEITTDFGVCELIFLNTISGILHLVAKEKQ